ncbi:thiamine pyrophosphate-binding protein [Mucilaginibacter pallidiroseus]|uniref:Thiamine pyrophosphate-binding protein n=1 Tax=Mucilaginibacter pallidiroseus TaxID=2599295 RepID=A0A563UIK1_9SPHI|nr:thiamine pyrophosphate-binding protein [Mucilaginibacter pallidiroseus]TWR31171.1 thiamine pyrophosphate-binding protein [Mucilaginibacter pallidiroseus]
MKASDFIALFLEKKGIKHVFELSGGMITHLLDSLNQKTQINIITMHHEQSAAFAADAYGRVTGLPGVALATSGPGATNLLTGIGSCYFDSTPAIFITGQVNRHEQKGDRNIRQLGFQETDIIAMAKPITKACFKVDNENDLPQIFEQAFSIACDGRPGPVLIDIPMDVQRANIAVPADDTMVPAPAPLDKAVLLDIAGAIKDAKRPLLLVGRGVRAAFATQAMMEFVDKTHLPVITTLLAVDAIPFDNPYRVGFIGSYGNRWANIAFGECDLLIVVGSRLDIRQTGADTKFFEDRTIYHVDCEAEEINNRIRGCIPVIADAKLFFEDFTNALSDVEFVQPKAWVDYIQDLKEQWPDVKELTPNGINPNVFIHKLSQHSQAAKCYLADVGSHQMWAAQSVEVGDDQLFLTSGGMGAMGYALPAGIGACFGLGVKPVIVIVGDGCMQINIQELQTIVRNKLPVKVIVMNNRNLGMIRQFQDSYFESRYQSTYWGYTAPDFEKVAEAYGINAATINTEDEIDSAVEWMWNSENADSPVLLQIMIDPHTNTYPKIAFGKPITEMEPFATPIEMEGT